MTSDDQNQSTRGQEERLSTRQSLSKISNCSYLYRHVNGTYYAIKKHRGKQKTHSLDTKDRKIAERRLKNWLANLDKVDAELEKTTLSQLLDKFLKTRSGKSESTKSTEKGIVDNLKRDWAYGLDINISKIRPSMLDEWLAKIEPEIKSSSYNRYTLVLKQLFDIAVNDRMIPESENPYKRIQKPWKKIEKPLRLVPTDEQFKKIVENIRGQTQNADCEQSANFIGFMGLAGLGQAEASSLTWGDVNWDKEELTVRRHKTKALFFPPIYPRLKPLLQRLYADAHTNGNPPLAETKIFSVQDARKALAHACGRLKFPQFTQRSIRAYLIRTLWQAKVDYKLIAKWQGHSDGGRLILNTYTEVFGSNDEQYIKAELSKLQSPQ